MDQKPIRPDRSRYFTSRHQAPQSDLEGKPLIGKKKEGVLKTLWRDLGTMVYALRHPVLYFKYGDDDPDSVEMDKKGYKFHSRPDLKNRRVSVDFGHQQKMTRKINKKIHEDNPEIGYDEDDKYLTEFERVRTVRIGEEDSDPGMVDPRDPQYKEEVRALRKQYEKEQEASQKRNAILKERFSAVSKEREDIAELAEEVEKHRKSVREYHRRIEKIPFGRRKEVERSFPGQDLTTKKVLVELRKTAYNNYLEAKANLNQKTDEYASKSDLEKETPEVMARVQEEMDNFVNDSSAEYKELMTQLKKFPTLMERLGGNESTAKAVRSDQIRLFRRTEIPRVEQAFIAAGEDEQLQKEHALDLHSKRLMMQRLDEINRLSESSDELGVRVGLYTEGRQYLAEGDEYEVEKQRLGKPGPQPIVIEETDSGVVTPTTDSWDPWGGWEGQAWSEAENNQETKPHIFLNSDSGTELKKRR